MHTDPQQILDILKVDYPNLTLDDATQLIVYGEATAKRVCTEFDLEQAKTKTKQHNKSPKLQAQSGLEEAKVG